MGDGSALPDTGYSLEQFGSLLVLDSAMVNMSGSYICRGENNFGAANHTLMVNVTGGQSIKYLTSHSEELQAIQCLSGYKDLKYN